MFSGIWTRCVPRAQVSVSAAGRSARASHPSTPAVSVWTQRRRGAPAKVPRGMRHARAASARARSGRLRRLAGLDGGQLHAPAEPRALDGPRVDFRLVEPQEDEGARHAGTIH